MFKLQRQIEVSQNVFHILILFRITKTECGTHPHSELVFIYTGFPFQLPQLCSFPLHPHSESVFIYMALPFQPPQNIRKKYNDIINNFVNNVSH